MTEGEVFERVIQELDRAQETHGPMRSLHEGYAVILEELDEVWGEVKMREPNHEALFSELCQVAAMAIRMAVDCVETREVTE